jgi:hypothetical protein
MSRLMRRPQFGFYRYITRNPLLRKLAVATQLQVYRTTTTTVAVE